MNTFPPKSKSSPLENKFRTVLILVIATTLSASAIIGFSGNASADEAQTVDASPRFTVEQSGKRIVNKGVAAYMKGDFSKAVAFNRNALHQGLKIGHKTVVYSNQCAALGVQGRYDDALEACDKALKLAPTNWQAFSNRAAVNWLNGDKVQAKQDIQAARNLDGQAADITYNINVFG